MTISLEARSAFIFVFIIFACINSSLSQNGTVRGSVTDRQSGDPLVGVNVLAGNKLGVSSDSEGYYSIELPAGKQALVFSYLGYANDTALIDILPGQTLRRDISMVAISISLDMAVVTAGKFEQRLADVTVSMEIIKPEFLRNNNTINLETAVNQAPGVDVLDGQTSIRGGGGYSYGAGSRVMILVNGLPMLTADVNEVKWSFLPVENIEQVEILKGASSALYGSSALNGVINFRTRYPGSKPQTNLSLYSGIYLKPERDETAWWWDAYPLFAGASFSHLRKAGPIDLIFSGYAFSNTGYRMEDYEDRIRFSFGFRHMPEKVKGLSYGFNTSFQEQQSSDFLIWQDADSGAFLQNPEVITPTKGRRFNLDPYIMYYGEGGSKHSIQGRFYRNYNRFNEDPDKNNGADLYYGEYQYQKDFKKEMTLTAGMIGTYAETRAELYGDHFSSTLGLFTQFDGRFFNRLSTSLGIRWERYTLNREKDASKPVIRAGINYQAAENTFIRTSFGQGYRFPSIAETYTATTLGLLNVFPNPALEPETSWSAEIGGRQVFKLGKWNGFVDLALFWSEYQDMIEFTFGIYPPDSSSVPTLKDVGFKSLNVGDARITGIDLQVGGSGYWGMVYLATYAGYTYMDPVERGSEDGQDQILKYRYRHSVKGDLELSWKKLSGGVNCIYNSHMERIDEAFEEKILGQEIFPGLKQYRIDNNKGFVVFDLRVAYQVSSPSRLALIVKNIFNREYMGRPGDIMAPRNVTLQYTLNL